MPRGEINITVTPEPDEIIQGQRSDTKRPEADNVSTIAGVLSGYGGQAALYGNPAGTATYGEDEGEEEAE